MLFNTQDILKLSFVCKADMLPDSDDNMQYKVIEYFPVWISLFSSYNTEVSKMDLKKTFPLRLMN